MRLLMISMIMFNLFLFLLSKTLFDAHPEDPDYTPPPEDRPGGFNWGQEADVQ